jgi:glycosyltransferase involved in cell wall biosynthesis
MMTENLSCDKHNHPLLSVIIPCYNSEQTIRRCLRSILNQQTTVAYDVIVVDSSSDQTPEIVQREFPSVRLIHLEKRTYAGAARNIGAQATSAQYCLMIDSDCLAAPDVIERMIASHQGANYAAVAGSLLNGTPGSLSGTVAYLIEFKEFMPSAPLRLEKLVPTASIAYRREILERYGYFDEDMSTAEDILFNWKITSSGERILFDPAMKVTHLNRTGWLKVLSYQVELGKSSASARRRGGLPGQILLSRPLLILLMPFVRTVNAAKWLMAHEKKMLVTFLFLWPMYLVAASFWTWGFFRQAIKERRGSGQKSPSRGS